jgi:hypothetical protein
VSVVKGFARQRAREAVLNAIFDRVSAGLPKSGVAISGGSIVAASKKTPTRAPAAAKLAKTTPKKAPGRRLPRRDNESITLALHLG